MTTEPPPLSPSQVLAAASETLKAGGYQEVLDKIPAWETAVARLFEDESSVVGVAVFDTCAQLLGGWPDLQGSLVNVVSRFFARGESKAWDGYLVLLTPSAAPSEYEAIDAVRYNTHRLRKIVATGDTLRAYDDIERVLSPLLPLSIGGVRLNTLSALDVLPRLLLDYGIKPEITKALLDAFSKQEPLVECLHQGRFQE